MKVILVLVVFAIVEVSMGNDDENCTLPAGCDRSLCPIPGCAQGSIYVDNDPCRCCPTCLFIKQKGEKCGGRLSNTICKEGLKCIKGYRLVLRNTLPYRRLGMTKSVFICLASLFITTNISAQSPSSPSPFSNAPAFPFNRRQLNIIVAPSVTDRPNVPLNSVPVTTLSFAEELLQQEWGLFRTRFNKVYQSAEEESFRREIFFENRAKINRANEEYARGERSFVQQVNVYADMLLHEFTQNLNGYNRSISAPTIGIPQSTTFIPSANVVFPESVDWREVGAVTPVKSQGKCAACWAFAAAGALEGHHFRKTGNLVEVSVQNLIDCTEQYGNSGCSGGIMNPAFQYVRDNNGVDSEQSYPFEEKTSQCRFKREDVVATCTGFVDIAEGDEQGLENALATIGPVTAAIDAGRDTFQFYSDGIYDDPECGNKAEQMNHAVLIVGYGQESDGKKYWLVKNSYGPGWGLGGYVKIAKGNGNQCGIAIQASYPLV
ncbi:hypothetical protein JTB14_007672 [Gonioctena quinquepunctata]|nr:hypothetical protein JTB14_007672 [Gonioctena quinquepunctata]